MDKESLPAKFESAVKKQGKDHLRALIKAGLNLIPNVGGPLASLIDDYIPNARQKRIEMFIMELATEAENIKDELRLDYIRTDNFAYLFEKTLRSVASDYHTTKMQAYRAILLNSLLPNTLEDETREYFLNLLDSLTPIHARILKAIGEPKAFLHQKKKDYETLFTNTENPVFHFPMEPYSEDIVKGAWRELYSKGLVAERETIYENSTREYFETQGHLTELGKCFIEFISTPKQR